VSTIVGRRSTDRPYDACPFAAMMALTLASEHDF